MFFNFSSFVQIIQWIITLNYEKRGIRHNLALILKKASNISVDFK